MPRRPALTRARQATAGALLAATLFTGGVVVHLADASADTVATTNADSSSSSSSTDSSSSSSSSDSSGFSSSSDVSNSSSSSQSSTGGS